MTATMDFLSLLRMKRPDFQSTMTHEEHAAMREHAAYVRDLFDEGKITLGGSGSDGELEVLIYHVDTAEEARRLFYNDPAVMAGIGYPELHPFVIGHPEGK
jgi:hypothetical protein